MKLNLTGSFALGCLTLSTLIAAPAAQAQMFDTGNVAQSINVTTTSGGQPIELKTNENVLAGNFAGSTLGGVTLPWVYCVDFSKSININSTGFTATVTNNGAVNGSAVNNAGSVTWLLDHYAASATNADATAGLQAAIWKVIYGSQFTLNGPDNSTTDSNVVTDYNNDLAGVGYNSATGLAANSDPVSNARWISPSANGTQYQGLVTSAVPEPGNIAMLVGLGITGAGFLMRRKRKGDQPR
jgi:hypothetical protein